jgi:RNA polymerase sigma-70 factor (ECF subfamily)
MQQTLQMLKDSDREILWMRHHDGLSAREAGLVLGVDANAAQVRHVRALRRLKDLWRRLNPEWE